jgi:hypothetical protein
MVPFELAARRQIGKRCSSHFRQSGNGPGENREFSHRSRVRVCAPLGAACSRSCIGSSRCLSWTGASRALSVFGLAHHQPMRNLLILIFAALCATVGKADTSRTWTSTDGLKIKALYLSRDAANVTVVIDGKKEASKIPLSRLSADDLAWLTKQPASPSDLDKVAARLEGRVVSVTADGLLIQATTHMQIPYGPNGPSDMVLPNAPGRPRHAAGLFYLRNYPTEGVADNDWVDVDAWPDGTFKYTDAAGADATVHAWHVYNIGSPTPNAPKPTPPPTRRGLGAPASPTQPAPASNMGPATHL